MPQPTLQAFFGAPRLKKADQTPSESPPEAKNLTSSKIKTSKKHKLQSNSSQQLQQAASPSAPPFKRVHTLPKQHDNISSNVTAPLQEDQRKLFSQPSAAQKTVRGPLRKGRGNTWFSKLFGFEEGRYKETKQQLELITTADGDCRLVSKVNNCEYDIGRFENPTLDELRVRAIEALQTSGDALKGPMSVTNALGDVSVLIGENPRAVVQVIRTVHLLHAVNMLPLLVWICFGHA